MPWAADDADFHGAVRRLYLKLRPGPEAAGEARHALDPLEGAVGDAQLETVRLLATELISNAVRHGDCHEWIDLEIDIDPESVRVEVRDCGHGFPRPATPAPHDHALGGYGLCLVDRLADRWGVEVEEITRVWFELARNGDGELAAV